MKGASAEQQRAEASAPYVLEIAANSLASALAAQEGGASRIELCTALELGGLTPSPAQIALVRERLSIPVHVLVRPRAGDFAYGDEEHATMLSDIAHCAAAGCDGVVVGALTVDGDVDVTRCRELVAAADGVDLTFHRAIDVCRDPMAALEAVIGLGFRRVLSSGGAASAIEGSANLRRLIEQAAGRIEIMPGAGIDADNIATLMAATGAREFHASAKRALPSRMRFAPADALGMAGGETRSDAAEVRRLVEALRCAAKRT
ncbi:copper homeostasis protein CutC [Pseudoxanthomonas sacheonensis]|uniref:PF03932 family protein CutC n=1 Tax=Pseudoxanthomonas sacheonensis TaxID=443615 RepID=A0ABU1RPN6_9GAMM|nr:copper homeostasis protein CutC [Pseudoxanthomonas sacheonensis]MDR6840743.1 copper homeostasis protein [Pseudoxanthomonas sacheonensis]